MAEFSTRSIACPLHIDYHKSLKCPKLTTTSAYRSAKLTVRVLGIYNGRKGILHAFCYNELEASKGPAEIISCLHRLIHELNDFDSCRWLKIWSDNTHAEIKNCLFSWYMDHLQRTGVFQRIDVNFLEPGHGFSICDRLFAVLEKHMQKYTENLDVPEDVFQTIQESSDKINIIRMNREHFLDFETYFKNMYVKRFESISKTPFLFGQIAWMNFGIGERLTSGNITAYSHPGIAWFRKENSADCPPIEVDFCKQKQRRNLQDHVLELKYKTMRKPKNPKAVTNDLVKLAANTMSEESQRYYENMRLSYIEVFGHDDSEGEE